MAALDLSFKAPGPVAQSFLDSRGPVDWIMGPIGSAKTTTAIFRILFTAIEQAPHPATRIRKFSCAIIRTTYRDLERTTIPSWLRWVPKTVGKFTGGSGGMPAKHEIWLRLADGSQLHLVVHFLALGDQTIEDVTRGLEVTMFYLNEGDLLPPEALQHLLTRTGRDPSVDEAVGFAGATWHGIIIDSNAPDTENYLYDKFIRNPVPGWGFFRQPGGRHPQAENRQNLVAGYYERMAAGMEDWLVRRLVDNEFGYSREGKPVYPEYNDYLHVPQGLDAKPILPVVGVPIVIGLDAGLNASAVWEQLTPMGQLVTLHELITDGMGAQRFGELVDQVNATLFAKYDITEAVPDPSAFNRSSTSEDERSWVTIVKNVTRLKMAHLPTNALTPRLEAVRQPLSTMIDGRVPGYQLSPACTVLREGFNSGYRFRRINVSGGRFAEVPDKNRFSHPHDAKQYASMRLRGFATISGKRMREQAERSAHAQSLAATAQVASNWHNDPTTY